MYVVVNAAISVDGKLSTRKRDQIAISGPNDFSHVERLRATCDAVLVGIGTVLADDPALTVGDRNLIAEREDRGDSAQPARIVADTRARTPIDAKLLADGAKTYVLVGESAPADRVASLQASGAMVVVAGEDLIDMAEAFELLSTEGIERLLVEGGGELIFSLFANELVDELSVYVGSVVIGGSDAPTLVDGEGFIDNFPSLKLRSVDRVDDGVRLTYRTEE